jgi:hypothetical protein
MSANTMISLIAIEVLSCFLQSVDLLSGKLDRERRLESMKQERKYQDRTLIRQRQVCVQCSM